MTQEAAAWSASGYCALCEAVVALRDTAEVGEVITCPECRSLLVVRSSDGCRITFEAAPVVEEDWGQ